MPINNFLTCPADCDTPLVFGAVAVNQDCTKVEIGGSQVEDLVIVPTSASHPADWTAAADWAGVIDNTSTDGTKAKRLVGEGGIPTPEKVKIAMPKRKSKTKHRTYTLTHTIKNLSDAQYAFGRQLQCGDTSFKFYYGNELHLFGGQGGITPKEVDCDFPLAEGIDDIETMVITIVFDSDGDPARTINPFN